MPRACPEPGRRACPEPGRRGGKRPGAGAPRGNLNALKDGRYSPRFFDGLLAFALVPEARPLYAALKRVDARKYRRLLFETIAAAYEATRDDPDLARQINDLLARRISHAHEARQNLS